MENVEKKKSSFANYLLLYFALLVYSCCSIFNKISAGYELLSWGFIIFYGLGIVVLGVYAIFWQMVLKRFELSVAYANKPITTLLSMIWGVVLFQESVSWNMILGAAIILIGIRVVVTEHGK